MKYKKSKFKYKSKWIHVQRGMPKLTRPDNFKDEDDEKDENGMTLSNTLFILYVSSKGNYLITTGCYSLEDGWLFEEDDWGSDNSKRVIQWMEFTEPPLNQTFDAIKKIPKLTHWKWTESGESTCNEEIFEKLWYSERVLIRVSKVTNKRYSRWTVGYRDAFFWLSVEDNDLICDIYSTKKNDATYITNWLPLPKMPTSKKQINQYQHNNEQE